MMWDRRPVTESQAHVLGKELVRQAERYLRRYERDIRAEVAAGLAQVEDMLKLEADFSA